MTTKELIYSEIRRKVSEIYESSNTITLEDLLKWVNTNCTDLLDKPYGSLRSVIKAAWERGTDSEKEALEYAIVDKKGKSYLSR